MKIFIGNPAFRQPLGHDLERYFLGSGMRFPWSLLKRRNERPRYAMFPFFLAYTAALLEQDLFEVRVVDAVPLNLDEAEFEAHVLESNPDVVLLEPNTAGIDHVLQQAQRIRLSTGARIVLVGAHPSAMAAEILRDSPWIDFIVCGEYELVVLRLLQALRGNGAWHELQGLAFREADGRIVQNGRAPLANALDELPPPARHLFPAYFDHDLSLYHDGFCQYQPAIHMHTSRGCPFQCTFCLWVQVLYGNQGQRFFSPGRVVDEMEMLVREFHAQEIYFDDDNFSANREHVTALCNEMIRRGCPVRWSAMADAIALDESLLKCMAQAGCIGIKFGLDSADPGVLAAACKPVRLPRVEKLVEAARHLGIKTHLTVVLGLPGETKRTLERTMAYTCELDTDSIQFSLATPCPGTVLYDELRAHGRITSDRWEEFDGANTSVIAYEDLPREHLQGVMAGAHSRWLRAKIKQPRWLLRQLRYLSRVAQGQGISGLIRRFRRAVRLLSGDAVVIADRGGSRTMRW